MKRLLCSIFSFLIIISLTITISAEQKPVGNSYTFMPYVDGEQQVMIYNDYYKLFHNEIFEAEFASLKNYSADNMTTNTVNLLSDDNFIYAAIILKDNKAQNYSHYNNSVITSILETSDILYIGDTTPISVIKLTKENATKFLNSEQLYGIFPAFFPANILAQGIVGQRIMGDVTDTFDVTSADARFLLRFSAGLESVSKSDVKRIYFCGDMNFDGKINSADARIALRTAAKLEEKSSIIFESTDNWTDF